MLPLPKSNLEYAYHEAGHAIVARELGLRVILVTIETTLGNPMHCRIEGFVSDSSRNLSWLARFYEFAEKDCICLAGGYAADCIQFEKIRNTENFHKLTIDGASDDSWGVKSDWPKKYKKEIEKFGDSNALIGIPVELRDLNLTWPYCSRKAWAILDKKRNELKKLSCELDKSKVLTGKQIDTLLG